MRGCEVSQRASTLRLEDQVLDMTWMLHIIVSESKVMSQGLIFSQERTY